MYASFLSLPVLKLLPNDHWILILSPRKILLQEDYELVSKSVLDEVSRVRKYKLHCLIIMNFKKVTIVVKNRR